MSTGDEHTVALLGTGEEGNPYRPDTVLLDWKAKLDGYDTVAMTVVIVEL